MIYLQYFVKEVLNQFPNDLHARARLRIEVDEFHLKFEAVKHFEMVKTDLEIENFNSVMVIGSRSKAYRYLISEIDLVRIHEVTECQIQLFFLLVIITCT